MWCTLAVRCGAAIAKRVPVLPEVEALVLAYLRHDPSAAANALTAYLALRGCSGDDTALARLEITQRHYCCGLLTCLPRGVSRVGTGPTPEVEFGC